MASDLPSGKVLLNAGARIGGRVCMDWEQTGISDAHQAIRPKNHEPLNCLVTSFFKPSHPLPSLSPVYQVLSPSTPRFASFSMLLSFGLFLFSSSLVVKRWGRFQFMYSGLPFPWLSMVCFRVSLATIKPQSQLS